MSELATPAAVIDVSSIAPRRHVDREILIGKDILELLTGGMYVDPLCIFREYVQNACDAIDEAQDEGLYSDGVTPGIDITFDQTERCVRIRDNGIGIAKADFLRILTAIGGSHKRGRRLRGFRGVGRLSGLGYCQEVVFRSRGVGDSKVGELAWSGRRLKDILRAANDCQRLNDAVSEVAEYRFLSGDGYPEHFFEVELRKVARIRNDMLMNEKEVRSYLSEVAPVPFSPSFKFAKKLEAFLDEHGANSSYAISINDGNGPIFRPHENTFPISDKLNDSFNDARTFLVEGLDGETAAIGWILDHSYFGAIPKRSRVAGLRLRSGNIQIGSADLVVELFPESRFNGWCVGEYHVLSNKIVPNGRRDDFEPSSHYQNLLGNLAPRAREIAKTCRDQSILRNRLRTSEEKRALARSAISLLNGEGAPAFLVNLVRARVSAICNDLRRISSVSGLRDPERELIIAEVARIESALDEACALTQKNLFLAGMHATKRVAYEHVLRILYEVMPDIREAHNLSGRVIEAIRKDLAN